MESPSENNSERQGVGEQGLVIDLLKRLDNRLKNAHYWLTTGARPAQVAEAIMEARGITLRLCEKQGGGISFDNADVEPLRK